MVRKCKYFQCKKKRNCPKETLSCPGCGGEAYRNCGCGACVNQSWEGNVEICEVALSLREAEMEEDEVAERTA